VWTTRLARNLKCDSPEPEVAPQSALEGRRRFEAHYVRTSA
jgi:hypothetical protein